MGDAMKNIRNLLINRAVEIGFAAQIDEIKAVQKVILGAGYYTEHRRAMADYLNGLSQAGRERLYREVGRGLDDKIAAANHRRGKAA
jgi:hypothetical protein